MSNVTIMSKLRSLYKEVKQYATLVKQGDMPKAFYILVNGRLNVYRNDTLVSVIRAGGEYIGEISILMNTPHSATVKTDTIATVIEIEISKVESFLFHTPEVAVSLARKLAERLVTLNKEYVTLIKSNKVPQTQNNNEDIANPSENNIDFEKLQPLMVQYPGNETIIKQNFHPKALYILVWGEVEIIKDEKVIAIESNPGYYLGDVSVLRRSPANASVKTTKMSNFVRIPEEKIDLLLNRSPEIAMSISKGLAKRILAINDSILDMKVNEVKKYNKEQENQTSPEVQAAVKSKIIDLLGFDPDNIEESTT